jgi:hypothetical protein
MQDLILTLLGLGYTVTFESDVLGGCFVLMREMASGQLVNCVIGNSPEESLEAAAVWARGGSDGNGTAPRPTAKRVKLTVTGDCGHVVWTGFDAIEEKYPFWCKECEDMVRDGKYPWKLASEIVTAEGIVPPCPPNCPCIADGNGCLATA